MPKGASPKLRISEADVQTAVVQMLELDGWRAIRTDPVSDRSRGKGFGEVGMPDYMFIRYHSKNDKCPDKHHHESPLGRSLAQVMFIEFKAPGKTLRQNQLDWAAKEQARGALVIMVRDVEEFRDWYKTSGLMRNTILS